MFFILFCVLFTFPRAEGSMADQMAETTQLCCNQGTTYARNHSVEDCSSSKPPDVPSTFGSLCIYAMDQCCKEYFQKKNDCQNGIDIASSSQSCSPTADYTKKCCDQCLSGIKNGKEKGASGCSYTGSSGSPELLLLGDAFNECCKDSINTTVDQKNSNRNSVIVTRKTEDYYTSVCEEYAPNELCAHHCIPLPGSYKCECNPGFMLMADGRNCKELTRNRCKPHNPCQHKCNDNGIEVKCSCRRGFRLKSDGKSCEDIDECLLDMPVCLPNTKCFNVIGSYKCIPLKVPKNNQEKGQCPIGFARNFINNACDDINECKLPNPPCPKYLCENTIGGYKCGGISGDPSTLSNKPVPTENRCPIGFKSGINEECEDVDECATSQDDCNKVSQFCINTRGSFHCQDTTSKHCPPGFKANPINNKCEDIDECEEGEEICGPSNVCVNLLGEYNCKSVYSRERKTGSCPEGMRINPDSRNCEDIDECMEGTHLCDQHQSCLNTNGSHECRCKLGFELDSTTGACVDINECATDQNDCIPESQRCDNTVGSYLCIRFISCGTGYTLHHSSSACEDIDECALGTHNCQHAGPQYHCVNIPGSFRCQKLTTPAPSSSAPPEYEYEYYDSSEEIEDDKVVNKTKVETTTVLASTTTSLPPVPTYKNIDAKPDMEPYKPTLNEITRLGHIDINNNANFDKVSPKSEMNPEPVTTKNEINIDNEIEDTIIPENVKPKDIPSEKPNIKESNFPMESTFPLPTEPSVPEIDKNDLPTIFETTHSTIPIKQTIPKLVYVNVGKETATVQADKEKNSSVLVDTKKVSINEWTKTNQKPTDCQAGFEMDAYGACYDIDECATNTHSCSGLTESCRNTMGGYRCECALGFRREITSGDCLPIAPPPSSTTSSTTTSTTTTTTTTTPAPTSSSTRSYFLGYPDYRKYTPRPFRPGSSCDVGYLFNLHTGQCEDVNECSNGQANCAAVEICTNTDGGYRCECPPNWNLDPVRHKCVQSWLTGDFPPGYANEPVYEQQVPNEIIPEAPGGRKVTEPSITKVDDGGTVISCPWGTRVGRDNNCEDINECATGEAQCGPLQTCINLLGGYTCSCNSGFRLIGDHECEDINECAMTGGMPTCSQDADCVNTIGSYQCICHEGFGSAPLADKVCIDIDECSDARPGTLCEQKCNNVWGGYRCSCHRGYRLNSDNRTCVDVDECTEYKSKNLCVGRCINEPGKYHCTCPAGYKLAGDERGCIDIDECESGVAPCAGDVTKGGNRDVCLNTRGGYRCYTITCPPGYRLVDKHRCTRIQTNCRPLDWECAHQPSTYSYHFITFVSNLYLSDSKVHLFTLRGPNWANSRLKFQLKVVSVNAPPTVKEKADINCFTLTQFGNEAVMSLIKSLVGPQSIELELSMELYSQGRFGGLIVTKLFIHVSEYDF